MSAGNGRSCEYVFDPKDAETWEGKEGDECFVDENILNEEDVWMCPYHSTDGDRYCIIHKPVNEKTANQVNDFLSNMNNGDTNNIIGAELPSVDLSGNRMDTSAVTSLNFIHCDFLGESDFSLLKAENNVNFIGSKFYGGVEFDRGTLKKALNIRQCEFKSDVSFQATKFTSSDTGLNISESLFRAELDLEQAYFAGEVFISGIFHQECNMYGADFESSVNLNHAKFEHGINMSSISFSGPRLQFRNVVSDSLVISDSDISRCTFSDLKFGDVAITGTKFEKIMFGNLGGVVVDRDFKLSASSEKGLHLAAIEIDGKVDIDGQLSNSVIEVDLRDANMSGDFQQSNFEGVDLSRANFSGADLSGANLERCILTRTDLFETNFTGAAFYGAVFGEAQINEETEFGGRCVYDPEFEREADADIEEKETGRLTKAAGQYRIIEQLARTNAFPDMVSHNFIRRQDIHRAQHRQKSRLGRLLRATASKYVLEYGENPWRLIATGLIIVGGFGLLYPLVGGIQPSGGDPITLGSIAQNPFLFLQSIYYSTLTFTTLGMGDFQPVGLGRMLTTIETSLGAIIIALLVFVFGRRASR